jgi:hypothetical protein
MLLPLPRLFFAVFTLLLPPSLKTKPASPPFLDLFLLARFDSFIENVISFFGELEGGGGKLYNLSLLPVTADPWENVWEEICCSCERTLPAA